MAYIHGAFGLDFAFVRFLEVGMKKTCFQTSNPIQIV